MQLEPENQALLAKATNSQSSEQPAIINFLDTIGLGDTSVTYTDEEIQELVKAELLTKTICDQIDGVIILENPNSPSIQINQTYYKILKIFGPKVRDSIVVVISQVASVSHIPEAIDERIVECQKLDVPFIEWESKSISDEEKQNEISEFFDIVVNKLKPYRILQLKGLDA